MVEFFSAISNEIVVPFQADKIISRIINLNFCYVKPFVKVFLVWARFHK